MSRALNCVAAVRTLVQVEPGIRTIGASAWQSCQQLQIAKMPSTVVCLQDGAFQGCCALMMVLAPGCKRFGRRAFAECCSLSQMGTTDNAINLLADRGPYLENVGDTHQNEASVGQGSST